MRSRIGPTLFILTSVLLFALFASPASAATISCPNPPFVVQPSGQPSNIYTVDPAIDCVWSPETSTNIGGAGDDFITGKGINDAAYGNSGPTFGLTWTFLGSTGNVDPSSLDNINGLTFTNFTTTFANWELDASVYAPTYNTFALGVKDGSLPHWAVFLLDNNDLSGFVSMTGGNFSHFVLYGAFTTTPPPPPDPSPEPASLLLFGTSFAAVLRAARNRRRTV